MLKDLRFKGSSLLGEFKLQPGHGLPPEEVERWAKEHEARKAVIFENIQKCHIKYKKFIADVFRLGYIIDTPWDFVNTRESYPDVIPLLVELLERDDLDHRDHQGVIRSLLVKETKGIGATPFLRFYKNAIGLNDETYINIVAMLINHTAKRGDGPLITPLLELKADIHPASMQKAVKELERAVKKGAPYKRKPKGN